MRPIFLILPLAAISLGSFSCSSDKDLPPLVSEGAGSGASIPAATALFREAEAQQVSGRISRAARTFGKVADDYPLSDVAPLARYNQAQLLDRQGDVLKAFDAYQQFITRYRGSKHYGPAIQRQAEVAHAAADGEIKNSFLGLRSRLAIDKVTAMLEKVRDNAPQARSAPRAQYAIGELHRSRGNADDAIAAYRKLVSDYPDSAEAPEAQFKIGAILTMQAERGNQDRANLNRAREAYLDYISRYPNHSKVGKAREEVAKLGGQSVQRNYDIAEFYRKKGETASAVFYYREVTRSGSGPLRDRAAARLRELGAQ